MLDALDLSTTLDKDTYRTQLEALMLRLRSLQAACWEKRLLTVIVLEGWAAAGKGSIVKKLADCMDPRGFTVYPILTPTADERRYPLLWRFWQKLPARGKIGLYYHSWYMHVLEDRLFDHLPDGQVPRVMQQINAFERQLADDGVAIAKFWIHLSQDELKRRLKKYAGDPLEAWRVRPEDWQQHKSYDRYSTLAEEMLVQTSTGAAPWTLVEGNCQRWARVKVLTQVAAVLTEALDRAAATSPPLQMPLQERLEPTEPDLLAQVDLSLSLSEDDYKDQLKHEQVELRKLQLKIHNHQVPVLAIFEGWDAAGKGGAIKRLTDTLDPRSYFVYAFAAPTDEEKQHHYLWRFWRQLPTGGTIGIFDRSWYGRVLVERIERFATDLEWRRAYREINEFESQLVDAGYVLLKFWLDISPEEQLKRFELRDDDPFKQHKLTDEDWRNREKWSLYNVAVNQAILRTHTPQAPWHLVAANDKHYARVKVIQTVTQAIQAELKRRKT
ncbi:polyphosphate:AMP phosphotransferase [Oculatella sp. LEGE 06141]|nr:polyphosphate:AMP phosphotransferase [Oculatella sp. LEGE 06141]MBE9179450.1 polyphosphate:AMP phosphotransferase [Oculatella sp. LEGE 06141]